MEHSPPKSLYCSTLRQAQGGEHSRTAAPLLQSKRTLCVCFRSPANGGAMERLFDVITFDCYGTLIDWEEGIGTAVAAAAALAGGMLDHTAVLQAYGEGE